LRARAAGRPERKSLFRVQLLARLTYSKNFADERRKKDKELADQIRVQKGDYNSELEKGQREGRRRGDGRAT
jgi:hypothetical protein